MLNPIGRHFGDLVSSSVALCYAHLFHLDHHRLFLVTDHPTGLIHDACRQMRLFRLQGLPRTG